MVNLNWENCLRFSRTHKNKVFFFLNFDLNYLRIAALHIFQGYLTLVSDNFERSTSSVIPSSPLEMVIVLTVL